MHCTLCPDLTFRLMRIGCTLHDAERLAAFLMTGIVVVATIMGCAIRPAEEDDQEDRMVRVYPHGKSRITGMSGCSAVGPGNVVDSRLEHLLHF